MKLGVREVDQLVRNAVERHPNRRNPTKGGTCLYTSRYGRYHCIVGQVLEDAGIGAPSYSVRGTIDELEQVEHLTEEAVDYLKNIQTIFDGDDGSKETLDPRRWATALRLFDKIHRGSDNGTI